MAGVTRIDHLFLTHYHGDHYGNLIELDARMPVGRLYDHGPSIESDRADVQAFEARYAELHRATPRTVVAPGDRLPVDGVTATVVVSHSRALAAPLADTPGRRAAQPRLCAASRRATSRRSIRTTTTRPGFVMAHGRFRTVNLGDLTWSRELALMCPANPIGTIDLYLTTHHGLDQSGSPAVVHAIRPRVAVMNNGTRKGGAVASFQTLRSSPGLEDVWQLHWSYAGGLEHNAPGVMIANIDEPAQVAAVVAGASLAGGRGRQRRPRAGALPQGVGTRRRIVHGDQQPERVRPDLRCPPVTDGALSDVGRHHIGARIETSLRSTSRHGDGDRQRPRPHQAFTICGISVP